MAYKVNKVRGIPIRAYYSIRDAIRRCTNKGHKQYPYYGGRGITVCQRWINSYENFWEDMKEGYRENLQLERVDNNQGYFKENCKWATRKEQARNRRSNRFLTIGNEAKTITEWCILRNLKSTTVRQRIDAYGWSIKEALELK